MSEGTGYSHDELSMLTRAAEIGMVRTVGLGLKARGLVLLAVTDETARVSFEDVSVGDGSLVCAVCERVMAEGEVYIWVYVKQGKVLCQPCVGACMGAERPA